MTLLDAALIGLGYIVGSLSSAILLSRALGLSDPRAAGSGNPGATNMLRYAGRGPAAAVLLGDLLKGLVPTLAAATSGSTAWVAAATAVAACAGHIWPVFFGFRGGKAVATYAGTTLGLSWWLGLGFVVVWLTVVALTRISSLGALSACIATPLVAWQLGLPASQVAATVLLSAVVIVRHRANIRNIIRRTEGRIDR